MPLAAGSEPVFIFAGQSNMVGRCELPDGCLTGRLGFTTTDAGATVHTPSGVVFDLCWENDCNFGDRGGRSNGAFRPLQAQHAPGLGMDCFGPELAAAAALGPRLAELGVTKAHFIKFAMGSTNLKKNWHPENPNVPAPGATDGGGAGTGGGGAATVPPADVAYYPQFIRFCGAAMRALRVRAGGHEAVGAQGGDGGTISASFPLAGFFWLQGESDSSKAADANPYLANFQTFAAAVRRDLHGETLGSDDNVAAAGEASHTAVFPIVASPVVWHGKKVGVVNAALRAAGDGAVPCCVCVDPLSPEFGVQDQSGCAGHLTAEGVLDIGRRMGMAMPL